MAEKVYFQQCKKPENIKKETRKAFDDLKRRGYFRKISELPPSTREKIEAHPVKHFYPWRVVAKEDSVSTPIRMVVDPTMTGMNSIMAKGENRIGRVNEIIMRDRTKKEAWSSDISKMYNTLLLDESAYPYSLFLYNESLESIGNIHDDYPPYHAKIVLD